MDLPELGALVIELRTAVMENDADHAALRIAQEKSDESWKRVANARRAIADYIDGLAKPSAPAKTSAAA